METFRITTEKAELDRDLIYRFLAEESYWARGIPRERVELAIDNSLCFGGFIGPNQMAFARVISDYATFANLVDVVRIFVDRIVKRDGLGNILVGVPLYARLQ